MIELDGSWGEGGGALVRTALALSTLTGQAFVINNIRKNRPEPGLKAQHLTAINALKQIGQAETNAIDIGSTELRFIPGKILPGIYNLDIGTAGSISLLLQALLLPCLFARGRITIKVKGGTCGKWQASVYYLQNILLPQIQRFVEKIELKIIKPGYYPRGGGEISLIISPKFKLQDFDSNSLLKEVVLKTAKIKLDEQGTLEQIKGIINLSSELQQSEVGERIKMAAEAALKKYGAVKNIRIEYARALSIGGEVVLWAIFSDNGKIDYDNPVILGGDALIEKNKSSEEIGREAAVKLIQEISSSAAADHHLADQLIPFMSLLPESKIYCSKISNHCLTNIYVTEKFMGVNFKIEGNRIWSESLG